MEYIVATALLCLTFLSIYVVSWLYLTSKEMKRIEKMWREANGDAYVDEGLRKGWMQKRLFCAAVYRRR